MTRLKPEGSCTYCSKPSSGFFRFSWKSEDGSRLPWRGDVIALCRSHRAVFEGELGEVSLIPSSLEEKLVFSVMES